MPKRIPSYDANDPHIRGADSPKMTIDEAFKLALNIGTIIDTTEGLAVLLDVLPLKTGGYKIVCRLCDR